MQYIRPLRNPQQESISPTRESRSLKTDDVPGTISSPFL